MPTLLTKFVFPGPPFRDEEDGQAPTRALMAVSRSPAGIRSLLEEEKKCWTDVHAALTKDPPPPPQNSQSTARPALRYNALGFRVFSQFADARPFPRPVLAPVVFRASPSKGSKKILIYLLEEYFNNF